MPGNTPPEARSIILNAIRFANARTTDLHEAESDYAGIARSYTQHSSLSREEIVALFTERLIDYDAHVIRCTADEISSAIKGALEHQKPHRVLIPPDLPADLLPSGVTVTADHNLSPAELDCFDATVTLCTLGIAETGTLVLQGLLGQGRRATTLVPDVHICIVRDDDVVATVPQGFAQLESSETKPLTFVSGPSATADIEMTRIKGVHGPRFLHIIVVGGAPTSAKDEIL
jgi:L-lactate dehydrogenase complex protein LldG